MLDKAKPKIEAIIKDKMAPPLGRTEGRGAHYHGYTAAPPLKITKVDQQPTDLPKAAKITNQEFKLD